MKDRINKFICSFLRKRRVERITKECGCVCFCPSCKDPLNDQADCTDTDYVRYHCHNCGAKSKWTFDAAPIPLLLSFKK
jgi:hypothetical protein